MALRQGPGLTFQKFNDSPLLMKALGVTTGKALGDALLALLERQDGKRWDVLRNAFGVGSGEGETLDDRRNGFIRDRGGSISSIKRSENEALAELEQLLLDGQRPSLVEVGRSPGGFCNLLPDGNWMLCFRDLDGYWEWENESSELAFHAQARRPARLTLRHWVQLGEAYQQAAAGNDYLQQLETGPTLLAMGSSYDAILELAKHGAVSPLWCLEFERDGHPESHALHTWPATGLEFALTLRWGRVEYPPFVSVQIDDAEKPFFFETDLVMKLAPTEIWREIRIDWWWHESGRPSKSSPG